MVAGRLLFDHGGRAGRGKPGQQHGRLQLRGGHRRLVFDRDRVGRAPAAPRAGGRPLAISSVRAPIFCSGSRMRRIGRERRLASPSNVAVIGQPATAPMASRQPVPELPKSSARRRLGEAADADAPHAPGLLAGALHRGAQRPHGVGGADGVLALQHSGNARFPDRQRAQNQRAKRNRLVARHAHAAGQRPGAAGGQRRGLGGVHDGDPVPIGSVGRS